MPEPSMPPVGPTAESPTVKDFLSSTLTAKLAKLIEGKMLTAKKDEASKGDVYILEFKRFSAATGEPTAPIQIKVAKKDMVGAKTILEDELKRADTILSLLV